MSYNLLRKSAEQEDKVKTIKDFVESARRRMANDFNLDAWSMVAEKRMLVEGKPIGLFALSEESLWCFFEYFCMAAAEDLVHDFRPVILSQFPKSALSGADTILKLANFAEREFGIRVEEVSLRNEFDRALKEMRMPSLESVIARIPVEV